MQIAAQCSSLEAVGWGFAYYDLPKAFVPVLPYFIPPSSGDGDLDKSPLFKDRTWSLRKGFSRNAYNEFCVDTWHRDHGEPVAGGLRMRLASRMKQQSDAEELEKKLTLRSLLPSKNNIFPAFTMNTTSYEDGLRFLLANYRIPDPDIVRIGPIRGPTTKPGPFWRPTAPANASQANSHLTCRWPRPRSCRRPFPIFPRRLACPCRSTTR